MAASINLSPQTHFLAGGGELGALIRAHDWGTNPLGPPEQWPQSLKTSVRIMLTSRQPIWIGWGTRLIYLYNDAYKSIIGGKHPWALGRPTTEVWREIWSDIGPLLARAMSGDEGTYVEQQLLIMERNGYPEETYYTFSYSPIPDDDGSPGGIICANTDDTQRVISERQLALLRDVAASAVDSRSWREACERSARALATNRRDLPFALIYAAEPGRDELVLAGLSGMERGHPAAPETLAIDSTKPWPIAEALRHGEIQMVSNLRERFVGDLPSGAWQQVPSQAAVVPLAVVGGAGRSGALVVGLNPFRLLDEGYRAFLTLTAGEIAAGIGNAQAYEEERRRAEALAEIDRAKTTFFSNASHEFRTPLTLMLSPLENMLARAEAERIPVDRADLDLIHRNGLRLLKLVNTLLDFSRIEAGRVQATYEAVDLATLTADLASTFRSAIEQAGLEFIVDCPPLPGPIHIDRDMWEKIVLNLISNAFKYTLEGRIEIRQALSPDGNFVEFAIRDTGLGIPEAELPRLFDRFHRVENQGGRSQEGTGIGLALVQELTRLHGGAVAVESAVGRGSTFRVRIPTGSDHLSVDRIALSAASSPAGARAAAFVEEALRWLPNTASRADAQFQKDLLGPPPGAGDGEDRPRIVLADDNADMRDYVHRLLEGRYDVEAVADGAEALAAARRRPPDLVLSDVMMPRMGGFELVTALRDDAALQSVPVILLSARAGEEARVEGIESGADDYLTKPFNARELLARVAANIDLARARRAADEALREEMRRLETLNRTGAVIAAEVDLEPLVQAVTDAAVELTGAQFGAFFYNVSNDAGESYLLYTLSGVPREAFANFPQPRNTEVFGPTFRGEGVVRSDDIRKDPRYGRNAPHHGPPRGHLPVVSYLAVPVITPDGGVIGGLFFGHPEPGVFTEKHELIVAGIASQAAVAFQKARLFQETGRAAAELRRLNESLEQRIAAEIAQRMKAEEGLRHSQKMEAIGQLTGGVAHDFNNLLQVVISNLDMMRRRAARDTLTAADIDRLTEGALRGAHRAAALTQKLLAFARKQPLDPRPTDPNKLVSAISELLRRTLGEKIAMETVLAGGVWTIAADSAELENAIVNLALNSRDAMPDGGKLTIETANVHLDDSYATANRDIDPGQYVMIAVSDTGCGMTAEVAANAFDPFFTTKEVGHGTGLGLSQVYGFVKQSGGHVKIYSEPGQGTTVKLYLPRLTGAGAAPTGPAPEEFVARSSHGELVLLVEDDEDVRANSAAMLQELGYEVIQAGDGITALRELDRRTDVRLLFTDVGLPGPLNGRQLAEAALRVRPDLKALYTTGYARNAIVHNGRLDPGLELIVKPFGYAELAAKLRRILDGK